MEPRLNTIKIVQGVVLAILTVLSLLIFIFALLSGSEGYGGGIEGVLKNSPNTFPWAVLLLICLFSWRRKLLGGVLLILFGAFATYYFNFSGGNFFLTTFIMCLAIIVFGLTISLIELYITKASTENL